MDFNYERVQAKYRILENNKDDKIYTMELKKLIEIEGMYKKIYEYLKSKRALLTTKQYNNI